MKKKNKSLGIKKKIRSKSWKSQKIIKKGIKFM